MTETNTQAERTDVTSLPDGWVYVTLQDLGQYINGKAFKPKEWSTKGKPIIRIQNLNNPSANFNYCNFEVPEKFHVNTGDLLFAWSGTPGTSFGAHLWRGGEAVLNQHIFRIEYNESLIDKSFFMYALNKVVESFIREAHGTAGLAHITKKKFERTSLPLPPLPEQHRIVAKLDALMARHRRSQAILDQIPEKIKQFRQAVLARAVSGELTKDWRERNPGVESAEELVGRILGVRAAKKRKHKFKAQEEPIELFKIPQTWTWKHFGLVAEKIQDGTHHSPKSFPEGDYMYITAKNIKPWGVDLSNITFVMSDAHNEIYSRADVAYGDILYIKDGATTGLATVNTLQDEFSLLSSVGFFKFNQEHINPYYVAFFLNSPVICDHMLSKMGGSAIRRLTLTKLKAGPLALPPLPEQHEIVRRVQALFRLADRIEARYAELRARFDQLPQAILAKAFRGELVPQDPADEPAEVLLERVREAKNQ